VSNDKNAKTSPIYNRKGLCNAQSLRNKTAMIDDLSVEHDLDLFLFTESWLKDDDLMAIGELEYGGHYKYLHNPRQGRTGGGVGCLLKSDIKATKSPTRKMNTFEYI
jgi:hypothetical protein